MMKMVMAIALYVALSCLLLLMVGFSIVTSVDIQSVG